MPRTIREDYPGAWHHVMNRGRNRDLIYLDDTDAVEFLSTIQNTIERFGIEVHAYSLMPNHYHLLVRSPLGNISDAMKHLGAMYTQAFNRRHSTDGALFRGRFKSQLVKYEAYLIYLVAYIHLNPLKAKLITRLDGLNSWTSYRRLIGRDNDPEWLSINEITKRFGSPEDVKNLTMNLYRKSEPWPQGMRLDTGFFRWHLCPQDITRQVEKVASVSVFALIKDVCHITNVDKKHLKKSINGSGGNLERRFAVWALHHTTYLKHVEIGTTLNMSKYQVAKIVERSKKNPDEFGNWLDIWKEKYPEKVSTVKA